jgi:hypothetical protein
VPVYLLLVAGALALVVVIVVLVLVAWTRQEIRLYDDE